MFGSVQSQSQPLAQASFDVGISAWNYSLYKRVFDIVCSTPLLLLASPLMLLIAVAIKVSSSGPVLFRQKRVGRDGTHFEILKFRTMVHGAESQGPSLTRKNDNRTTRLGQILRRSKLDELPQFLNVMLGDMTLVGPRPDVPEYCAALSAGQRTVLRLKPGITGWATLYFRDEETILGGVAAERLVDLYLSDVLPRKVDLDLEYARKSSFIGDVNILLRTFASVLFKGLPGCSE